MTELSAQPKTIAIVGGGFSGTMVAAHLLRQPSSEPLKILLFERAPVMAKGAAYRTTSELHLLNVPMGNMSAFPDEPNHLVDWCRGKLYPADPKMFMPRKRYGEYLGDVLFSARARKNADTQFETRNEAVISCRRVGEQYQLTLENGEALTADAVVLALGNFPPGELQLPDAAYLSNPRYHGNPWEANVTASVSPEEPVLIIGTALTMVDMVLSLHEQGHRGKILAVSRHGFLPQTHQAYTPPAVPIFPEMPPARLSELFKVIRSKMAESENWRAVIDGLRPYNQLLWQGFTYAEKRRFLRHVRPWWEVHRHRIAPELWQTLQTFQEEGYLRIQQGHIQAIAPEADGFSVTLRDKHQHEETCRVAHVFNCAGARTHYAKLSDPLVQQLITDGLMQPDPLNLGLEVDATGALKDSQGQPASGLYTLGPPLKGMLWETTAVPELRVQAKQLAQHLASRLLAVPQPSLR